MRETGGRLVTLDIDWAPDWIIDEVAQVLIDARVRATWFVTHASPAIARLKRQDKLFELGIHPNCLPGSTQGSTEDEVLQHLSHVVGGAVSMRTHGLYQSSNFLMKAARDYGISIDASLFLPRAAHLAPHRFCLQGVRLWRVPCFWEDDFEIWESPPVWHASDDRVNAQGLKIFTFHPVHVVLNTIRYEAYDELKSRGGPQEWTPEMVASLRAEGDGPQTMFLDLAGGLAGGGRWIKELVQESSDRAGGDELKVQGLQERTAGTSAKASAKMR